MNSNLKAQFINVDVTSYTPQQLVEEFLGAKSSTCISISGVKVKGDDTGSILSYGYFDKGTSNFDINRGIILSTGDALKASGPNSFLQSERGTNWDGDTDLYNLLGVSNTNATYLEFDFVSYISDKVSFEYMFLSEEYDKDKSLSGCGYSDIFAFLIKPDGSPDPYTNIALVPGTNEPVTVVNIRGVGGKFCPPKNENYFGAYNIQSTLPISPTNFNGQTKVLTANANVQIGKKYHIKLVIGDESNPTHDSAVFLKAGSFVGIKDLGADLTLDGGNALCAGGTHQIDATPDPLQGNATNYKWYRNGVLVASGIIPKYFVDNTNTGYYEVEVDLDTNCKLKGHINIELQVLPIIGATNFNVCDEDLDGKADATLNSFTSQVVSNLSQDYGFDIKYFEFPPANINNPTETILTNAKFDTATKDVYMWLKPGRCAPTVTKITLNKNSLSTFDNTVSSIPFDICDDKLVGKVDINLTNTDYINSLIPSGFDGKLDFYKSRAGANKKDSKEYLSNTNITLDDKNKNPSYFVRFHQLGLCDNVAEIKFNFKQPKKSTAIQDTVICKNSVINLDAGTGLDVATGLRFSSYKWYKASDPSIMISDKRQSGDLATGDYIVELGFNGCVYKQFVKISEPLDLIIDNILIQGEKITIQTSNGLPLYQYFLDGNKLSSNIIQNLAKGKHIVEVKDQCGSVFRTFYIINEKNVITPNDDGYNDIIDYSDLLTKQEPRFEVYDRNGVLVFKGGVENQYKWDGKIRGKSLPTASYWYILEWNESGNPNRVQKTGWILLKNRNSN